jgi:hypothetical protein
MTMRKEQYVLPTGSHESFEKTKIIDYEFYPYTIKVKVGAYNQFIEVTEVGLSKSFLNEKTKTIVTSTHDFEEYYK